VRGKKRPRVCDHPWLALGRQKGARLAAKEAAGTHGIWEARQISEAAAKTTGFGDRRWDPDAIGGELHTSGGRKKTQENPVRGI